MLNCDAKARVRFSYIQSLFGEAFFALSSTLWYLSARSPWLSNGVFLRSSALRRAFWTTKNSWLFMYAGGVYYSLTEGCDQGRRMLIHDSFTQAMDIATLLATL